MPFDHTWVLGVLLLPAFAAFVAARLVGRERALAPSPRRLQASAESRDAARLAPPWYESFGRARAGQALGEGWRRHARIGLIGGAAVAAVAALVVGVLGPLAAYATLGAVVFEAAVPKFSNTREKARIAEVTRPFVVPKDARITPMQAGEAFYALQQRRPGPATGAIRMKPVPERPVRPWTASKRPSLFRSAMPGTPWDGPHPQSILEAVPHGFSAEELAYLRMVATADVWRDWGIVARAPAGDILGASVVLPFAAHATAAELPIPRFAATKELAYASVSRAAYHMGMKQADSAETALRETISVGFFLVDHGNTLIEELIGVVIVGIGRDALTRFYALTGNPAGPPLKAKFDAAVAARDARTEVDPLDQVEKASTKFDAPTARRRVLSWASQSALPRGFRLEMLSALGMAPCSNVRELIFGPDREIRDAFHLARQEMVRYPADSAFMSLLEDFAERGLPRAKMSRANRLIVNVAGGVGFLLHNRRLRGCMEIALGGWL